jgi:hypothetical protein
MKREHERQMDKEKLKVQGEDKQLHSKYEYGPEM